MSIEVKVPTLPESVTDATIAAWHKSVGDKVTRDENLLDLETDKVVLEVPAPSDGVLSEILFQVGETVTAQQILARIEAGAAAAKEKSEEKAPKAASEEKAAPKAEHPKASPAEEKKESDATKDSGSGFAGGPSRRRLMAEQGLTEKDISQDSRQHSAAQGQSKQAEAPAASSSQSSFQESSYSLGGREERRVPMSRLRAKIAERLVQAQHQAAMLTTFNEVNLHSVMNLRQQYKDSFEKKHGVKLGFMSFFTKAVVEALKRFPAVNASIDGNDILYHSYYDVGIAVSTERGLVVPVVRNADMLSMPEIEKDIQDLALRARQGKLKLEDMQGGTFTITNGGVFGSLLATPIINPPQTAILGMHKIEDRPIVEKGEIVIRPMMYIALSYDHRLIDGQESVQFLVAVKSFLEEPARLLLDL